MKFCVRKRAHYTVYVPERDRSSKRTRKRDRKGNARLVVFIDGEGQGANPHRYVYLSAVDEHGTKLGSIVQTEGLSTRECLDFFLHLGPERLFGFALGYDLTKVVQDLPARSIYRLARPETRAYRSKVTGRIEHGPVHWNGYLLNYVRGKFSIQRGNWNPKLRRTVRYGKRVVIWDVFRFFGCKFTTALIDWGVADKSKLERMADMKDKRDDFASLPLLDIMQYCDEECLFGASLVRALITAHEDADLQLRSFHGAGSTASALLKRMGVKEYLAAPPDEMRDALARGFFGGRFEISRVGPVSGPVYNYDISSAYPYQCTFLPCLKCGAWEYVARPQLDRIADADLALVHCAVDSQLDWGLVPFRLPNGSIVFPRKVDGAWVWRDECLAAAQLGRVEPHEAWLYHVGCDHRPFASLPETYKERLRIGKEGKGIVLKLGMNSIYGKTAQSVGQAQFQSWVWAGNITSNTRAMLLGALGQTNLLQFATDGVFASGRLTLPIPRATDTLSTQKPLGGWEEKLYPHGVFLVRPGIYFPLEPTDEMLKDVKARGMAKSVLLKNADAIQHHFRHTGPLVPFRVEGLRRFVGMKSGVYAGAKGEPTRKVEYGEWVPYPVDVSFAPEPKRREILKDNTLSLWEYISGESAPYDRSKLDADAKALKELEEIVAEQATGDMSC